MFYVVLLYVVNFGKVRPSTRAKSIFDATAPHNHSLTLS